MNYLAINSRTCRASIAKPASWGLKEITVTTDGWNNRSVSESVLWDMVVPARFAPHLNAKFQPERANAADTITSVLDTLGSSGFGGSSLGRDMLRVREAVADIEAFMAQVPCGGPMQRQMEEMLFHHLAGINPTRHSDLAFTGDDLVIEPLYEPGSAQTLKTACLANRDFGTDRDDFSRCGCIAEKMQRHAPDKVAHYTENFSTWFRDVKKAEDALRAQGTDADRALYATHRQCMAGMH